VRAGRLLPWVVVASGIALTSSLVLLNPGGVFYSGDGGLKFLLARQFARDGIRHVDLDFRLRGPTWAEDLWRQGFYPFASPYVQERKARRYIVFPPYFSLVTAPFYRWFGFRGLYLVPLVSVWLVWVIFLRLVQRLRAPPSLAFFGILALIWTTPLTLYGALYWEHALAVLLVFAGVAAIASPAVEDTSSRPALAGALIGLAAWFRPEVVLLGALLGIAFLVRPGRRGRFGGLAFSAGLLVSLLPLAVFNLGVSGTLFGFHGAVGATSPVRTWSEPWKLTVFGRLMVKTLVYAPWIPAVFLLWAMSRRKWAGGGYERILLVVSLVFLAVIAFFLPKTAGERQWGPRYLLVLVPIVLLEGARLLASEWKDWGRIRRGIAVPSIIVCFLAGGAVNGVRGPIHLWRDLTRRVHPMLISIQGSDLPAVVVSNQWLSQELATAFPEKAFFLAGSRSDLDRLLSGLDRRKIPGAILVQYPPAGSPFPHDDFEIEPGGRKPVEAVVRKESHYPYELLFVRFHRPGTQATSPK